jgi:glycosyltransferase involved in cell wall biosynthesis
MSNKPLRFVSIVIPTWNRAKTLPRVIDSVLAQTYPNFELIVSDNASSDNTRELIESYRQRDSRVRYLGAETNNGPVKNWIRGVGAAKGALVKVLFSDDTLNPEYLAHTVSLWDLTPPPRFVYTGSKLAPLIGQATAVSPSVVWETPASFLRKSLVTHGDVPVSLSAGLFLKEDLVAALGRSITSNVSARFDFMATGVGYDQSVYLYAAKSAGWIARLPFPLVHFGTQDDSITIKTNRDKPGLLVQGYLWAQLCFLDRAYADRPILRSLLRLIVRGHLLRYKFRHHRWVMRMLSLIRNKT